MNMKPQKLKFPIYIIPGIDTNTIRKKKKKKKPMSLAQMTCTNYNIYNKLEQNALNTKPMSLAQMTPCFPIRT